MAYTRTTSGDSIVAKFLNEKQNTVELAQEIEIYAHNEKVFVLEVWAKKLCPKCREGDQRTVNPATKGDYLDSHKNDYEDEQKHYYTRCNGFLFWKALEFERIRILADERRRD